MQVGRFMFWSALVLSLGAAGCAGNGNGLDQNGQPVSAGATTGGPITADFQSIQDNVFTPICAQCHIGASAPEGLQLDSAHSYNLLVGVPSDEQPSLLRVNPGNPDESYMVHKIEGAPGITGGQMPLGETPLPQTTIDAIRQWITNGAPNATAPAVAAAAARSAARASLFAVQTTAPMDKATVRAPLARIVVTFSEDADASLVNGSTVMLEKLGGAGDSALTLSASIELAARNTAVLLINPSPALAAGKYRVTLRGAGGAALANLQAETLGADASFEFTVEAAQ